jgi:cobalt-zinc-cadmium efflux system outer membrane protein
MMRQAQSAIRCALFVSVIAGAGGQLVSAQIGGGGGHSGPTPLADLLIEADNNNTEIAAAEHAWRAAKLQAQTAAGTSAATSNQASSASTQPEAATQHAQIDTLRAGIRDRVKTIYLRLAYLFNMYGVEDRGEDDLTALIQTQLSRYGSGQGSQSEVIEAQIERTKLLREITLEHEEVGGLQAELKGLLRREPDSPEIVPEPTTLSTLKQSASELMAAAGKQNPTLIADRAIVDAQSARLESIRHNVEPDTALGFMLRHTDPGDPDNYVLVAHSGATPSASEAAQAAEILESSRSEESEDRLRQLAEVQRQYTFVTSSEDLLRESKDGLIPQSKALYESKLAAYKTGRDKFSAVIEALLNELSFEDQYLQAILEHETSLAHLETLTGEKLR